MAKVLVIADRDCPDVGLRARQLLGDAHEYKVVAVAPDRSSPFLDDETTSGAQGDTDREYEEIAERAAAGIGGDAEVRAGNPVMEAIEAATVGEADILVLESRRPRLWGRLTERSAVQYALSHSPCAVLFLPSSPAR